MLLLLLSYWGREKPHKLLETRSFKIPPPKSGRAPHPQNTAGKPINSVLGVHGHKQQELTRCLCSSWKDFRRHRAGEGISGTCEGSRSCDRSVLHFTLPEQQRGLIHRRHGGIAANWLPLKAQG